MFEKELREFRIHSNKIWIIYFNSFYKNSVAFIYVHYFTVESVEFVTTNIKQNVINLKSKLNKS